MNSSAWADWFVLLPEIWLAAAACAILILDLYVADRQPQAAYVATLLALAAAAPLVVWTAQSGLEQAFGGSYVQDALAIVLKLFTLMIALAVFVYSREYLNARGLAKGEFHVLGIFAVLGMLIMISAHSLLLAYLGLELMSLSLYAMVAFDRDSPVASEAAMKYFVLGALSSGMLLYGFSMLYGATGSLDLTVIAQAAAQPAGDNATVLVLGLVFVVVGLAFKLGAVPFHMWIPDVYHGAPTAVTLLIGTVPKLATFALFMRLLAEGMDGLSREWIDLLTILAVLSVAAGNVIAIAQTNIKRMLAYSTISHAGFILLGIVAGDAQGYGAALFYVIAYTLMAAGSFGMVLYLSRAGFEADRLEDFKGLNERNPWFAFVMLVLMISSAGVPLTIGFYAKLAVLKALVDVGTVWLAVWAVLFSVVGAYYYLRVVMLMYFDQPDAGQPAPAPPADLRFALGANGVAVLALGLFPGGLMSLCLAAMGG